jgi:hypothetical protein
MTKESANNLNKISIPDKDWFSKSDGIKIRNNDIDPLLISLHKIKQEINNLEKKLQEQIELKKQKHNYKEIWLGFDNSHKGNKYYFTTSFNKKRFSITWAVNRQKNLKKLKNKMNKIVKMLEVYLNQTQ